MIYYISGEDNMTEITQINAGSNCYLLTNNGSSILIDSGFGGNEDKILKACEGKNIRLIVLTHGHIDHVQNAMALSEKLNAPIAINEKDVPLLSDNLCQEMNSKGFVSGVVRFFSVMSAKGTKMGEFKIEKYLKEGDSLNDYGIDATILELPGHTKGSIGVKLENDNAIFVGDALMHMTSARTSMLYENYEDMINSAKRIEGLGELDIYFGHGKMVKNRKWV